MRVAVDELVKEGYDRDSIEFDFQVSSKRVDLLAHGKRDTLVECKSFKHTNDYTAQMNTAARKILVQPFFDVDEMWLVFRTRRNRYRVVKVQKPADE